MSTSAEAQVSVEQNQYIVTHPIFGVALTERHVRLHLVVMLILALACAYNIHRIHLDYTADKDHRMLNNLPVYIYSDEIETTFVPYRFICVQRYWYSLDNADKPAIWYIWLTFTFFCWLGHFLCVWMLNKIAEVKARDQFAQRSLK